MAFPGARGFGAATHKAHTLRARYVRVKAPEWGAVDVGAEAPTPLRIRKRGSGYVASCLAGRRMEEPSEDAQRFFASLDCMTKSVFG